MHRAVCLGLATVAALAAGAHAQSPKSPQSPGGFGKFSHVKRGLWEVNGTVAGHSMSMRLCMDESLGPQLQAGVPAGTGCEMVSTTSTPTSVTVVHNCKMGEGITAIARTTIGGDPDSHYEVTMNMTLTTDGKPEVMTEQTIADYKGVCPSDWKPGDMEMEGMPRMNMSALLPKAQP